MPASTIVEPFRVQDAIPLPASTVPVMARAERRDAYPVYVVREQRELLDRLVELLDGAAAAIVTDETVEALYGAVLVRGLREAGIDPLVRVLPAGEHSKSLDRAIELWDWLADSDLARRDVVIAFGGGVIADLGGWVASAYMRGLPYVNVPTTLLAQVDGALGGKVAVNHPVAKNLLGAFHQPAGVVADVGFLRSQDGRHLRAGLAECIKKAVIASPDYWRLIDSRLEAILARDLDALEELVRGAAAIKTRLIARDPYEADLRRPLNFGHTVGHPLETASGYRPLLHGEAVALGMVVESRIAAARGLMAAEALDALVDLLRRAGLPTRASELPVAIDADAVEHHMEKVRLIRAGSLRYVLPVALGETVIADDVDAGELRAALAACGFGGGGCVASGR
ncbi:MAG: 3-dehydroquinate synthase [Solirubrobacteraceae bacterium]|jgi:3-dehydroquinate synthase|nr:3-dehydroquinate synthase [Solirubrobacteraceae bacterium]